MNWDAMSVKAHGLETSSAPNHLETVRLFHLLQLLVQVLERTAVHAGTNRELKT